MAFFKHILLNILENRRAKNFKNSAKCAYQDVCYVVIVFDLNLQVDPFWHLCSRRSYSWSSL